MSFVFHKYIPTTTTTTRDKGGTKRLQKVKLAIVWTLFLDPGSNKQNVKKNHYDIYKTDI